MKKILIGLLFSFLFIYQTNGYIDYRHDIKKDYYSSEIFMNNHNSEKKAIEKKLQNDYKKIKSLIFEDKVDYIEKINENILKYLFSHHVAKNNVIYYRMVYYYNNLDDLKYKTDSKYKTKNYTGTSSSNYNYHNNKCNFYYNNRYYSLSNNAKKTFYKNGQKYTFKCSYGSITKDIYRYSNYNSYNSYHNSYNYYNNNLSSYLYSENNSCTLNVFGDITTLSSGSYTTVFKEYNTRIEYRKYSCDNGDLSLEKTWYQDIYNSGDFYSYSQNNSCTLNLDGNYYKINNGDSKYITKYYYLNGIKRSYMVQYYCNNGIINVK